MTCCSRHSQNKSGRCEGLTAMLLKIEVIWGVTVCLVGCDSVLWGVTVCLVRCDCVLWGVTVCLVGCDGVSC